MNEYYKNTLDRLMAWSRKQDYAGYSKFDAFNSPVIRTLTLNNKYLRMFASPMWARSPVNLRPWLFTKKSRNPKGIALFAAAALRRYRIDDDGKTLDEGITLLDWLDHNSCEGYTEKCWGYDHDWQNLHFFVPKYTPNIVVTGNVAYAFLEAFEITKDNRFLETARSSVRFMLNDLEAPYEDDNMRNISYIPGNSWAVLNINGLAAAIMVRVWKYTGEKTLLDEARRLIAFLMDKQTDYGAWNYAWPARTSNVKHDNYHTGNVLDWILDYMVCSGERSHEQAFLLGLEFYRERLFTNDGGPKWRSDRTWPMDVHGAAQGIVTFAKAAVDLDAAYLKNARRTADWAIQNLQAPEGYFYYQKGRFCDKKYTLMRWCNAWMAYALASLMLAEQVLERHEEESCAV